MDPTSLLSMIDSRSPPIEEYYDSISSPNLILRNFLDSQRITYDFKCPFTHRESDHRTINLGIRTFRDAEYRRMYNSISLLTSRCQSYAIIPFSLHYGRYGQNGHDICVVYLKRKNKFYVFDSSGYSRTHDEFHDDFRYFFGDYEYISNAYLIQQKEGTITTELDELDGYCTGWTCIFIYLFKKYNGRVTFDVIIDNILTLNESDLRSLVRTVCIRIIRKQPIE